MFDYSITSNKHPYTLEKTNEIVPDYLYIEEELYVAIIVNNMTQGIVYNWGMWAHKEVSEALMSTGRSWYHSQHNTIIYDSGPTLHHSFLGVLCLLAQLAQDIRSMLVHRLRRWPNIEPALASGSY